MKLVIVIVLCLVNSYLLISLIKCIKGSPFGEEVFYERKERKKEEREQKKMGKISWRKGKCVLVDRRNTQHVPTFLWLLRDNWEMGQPSLFWRGDKGNDVLKGVWSGKRSHCWKHCWAQIEFLMPDLFSNGNFLSEQTRPFVCKKFLKEEEKNNCQVWQLSNFLAIF